MCSLQGQSRPHQTLKHSQQRSKAGVMQVPLSLAALENHGRLRVPNIYT